MRALQADIIEQQRSNRMRRTIRAFQRIHTLRD